MIGSFWKRGSFTSHNVFKARACRSMYSFHFVVEGDFITWIYHILWIRGSFNRHVGHFILLNLGDTCK